MIAPPLRSTPAVPPLPPAPPSPPSGSRERTSFRLCHHCHRPRHRRWRANRTRLFARCRSTTAGRPCRPSHRYRRRRPGSCQTSRLWMNRRQRRQPPRPTAHCAPLASARMAPLATSVTEPPEPPAPPVARDLFTDSVGIVYSAIAALASERIRDEPERRQTGALVRHESAAETHRQIAASATGAASAASDARHY